jgi:gliding motility-associated-like protein
LPVLLATVPGSVTFLEDDVSQLLFSEGEFCYLVRAIEEDNGYSLPGSADSNERCLTQEPVIWVPNAFLINGFNNTFQPVISFADFDNYRLQVYSRWGDVVFETFDIEEAWDGVYRDELVPEGLYAWFVSVTDGSGRIYEKRGTVFMMVGPED